MKNFKSFHFFQKMKPKLIPVNEEFKRTLDWREISEECDDLLFLEENLKNLVPEYLSKNYHAVPLLMKHKELIDLRHLGANTNPIAIDYFETKLHELENSTNKFGITEYKLDFLLQNTSKRAIKLIEKILMDEEFDKKYNVPILIKLSSNESAINMLEAYFKDEDLNGEELNKESCFLDTFESGWGQFHVKVTHREMVFKKLASNKNASPYLINKINTFIDQCDEYSKTSNDDSPKFCNILQEMLKNKKNKNMVDAAKKWIRKFRRDLYVISHCIDEMDLEKDIDLLEELLPVLLDIKSWYMNGYRNGYVNPELNESLDSYNIKDYGIMTDRYVISSWMGICSMEHPRAMEIVQENIEFLIYLNDVKEGYFEMILSKNPLALPILESYQDKFFNVNYALENPNKEIYPLIQNHFGKINWSLFKYDNSEPLEDGEYILDNVNPEVFPESLIEESKDFTKHITNERKENEVWKKMIRGQIYIRKYITKLYQDGFKHSSIEKHVKANSFEYCRKNLICVNTSALSMYPSGYLRGFFYEIDYEEMKKENIKFSSEVASYVFNPARVERMADSFGIEFSDYLESLE